MTLATRILTPEQIQLLADCIEPIVVFEVPAAAEELKQRGLLVSSRVTCDDLSCHFLAVTERGRIYVTAWVKRQERAQLCAENVSRRLIKFPADRPS